MVKPRIKMPKRPPEERIKDFKEVALGFDGKQAVEEASRCLNCPTRTCVKACPVGVDVPKFLKLVAERKFEEAYFVIKEKCPIPAMTGRVCPQEQQCEGACVLAKIGQPLAIGAIERFVADWARENGIEEKIPKVKPRRKKIAVVGSGPSGIVVAADLAKLGYEVTMFEAFHVPGGVLVYGIPEYRLPKEIVRYELKYLEKLGVNIETGVLVGRTISMEELLEEYDAIFLGVGAGHPRFLNIPGENYAYIYTANEFLVRINLMKAFLFPEYDTPIHVGERVAVIGAGNTAMDAARSALRLGAKNVTILYRRTRREMPARAEEIENAEEEGIKFIYLVQPIEFLSDNGIEVSRIKLMKMRLGPPDKSGRPRPLPTGHTMEFKADTVINAIGFHPNPLIPRLTPGLKTDSRGRIIVDDMGRTSLKKIYAGGDIVIGEGTVIEAMGCGRKASTAIHKDLINSIY